MSETELAIIIPGDDAQLAVRALDKLMTAMTEINKGAGVRRASGRTKYRLVDAKHGSLVVALAPAVSADSWTASRLVQGIASALERVEVPRGWTTAASRLVAEVARMFPVDTAPVIQLREDGHTVRVEVNRAVAENLVSALAERHMSIGAVVGRLESITTKDRCTASVWIDGTGKRIPVWFQENQLELVKSGLHRRVMASGRMLRNGAGDPVRLTLRSLEVLQSAKEAPPLTDLIGLDPDFTGGLDAVDYLKELRGAA